MDTDELVGFQIEAGRRALSELNQDGFEVTAAFWVKTAEEGIWFLYVATPLVESHGLAQTYRMLQASLSRLQGIALSLSDVKLVGAQNPITTGVLNIIAKGPGLLGIRYVGKRLGIMTIEEAYLYPTHFYAPPGVRPMSRVEILNELVRLFNRAPGPLMPSRVNLRDGGSFAGIPFSFQTGNHGIVVQFLVHGEPTPRVLGVDEIASVE